MIYEGQVTYKGLDEKNGGERTIKENYVIEHALTFTEAENALLSELTGYNDVDVCALKRSKVMEIANKRNSYEEYIWEATIKSVFLNDDGSETETVYKILLFAKKVEEAMEFINNYMKEDMYMEFVGLKKTKFVDVLHA